VFEKSVGIGHSEEDETHPTHKTDLDSYLHLKGGDPSC